MKKVIVMFFLFSLTFVLTAQIFKPVSAFPDPKLLRAGELVLTHKWQWRFDATVSIVELNYNKETKQFISTAFSAVGPAIGYQHFVPTSEIDPTPFNNYGISGAFLLGENIYNPELAKIKLAIVANVMEYFKFGITVTPKPVENVSPVGLFFGGGVTF